MYAYAYDKSAGLMIGVLNSTPYFNEDEDFAVLIDSIAQHVNSGRPGDPFKLILVVDPHVPMPSAMWRRRFAKTRDKSFFPFLFVVVTPSQLLRGVLTMINWVSPAPDGSATNSVATFDEGVAWLEKHSNRKISLARKLLEEASRVRR